MKNKRAVLQVIGFSTFFGGIGVGLIFWNWRFVAAGVVLLLICIAIDAATDTRKWDAE